MDSEGLWLVAVLVVTVAAAVQKGGGRNARKEGRREGGRAGISKGKGRRTNSSFDIDTRSSSEISGRSDCPNGSMQGLRAVATS